MPRQWLGMKVHLSAKFHLRSLENRRWLIWRTNSVAATNETSRDSSTNIVAAKSLTVLETAEKARNINEK